MKPNRNDLRTYQVQSSPCKTCPFDGETPLMLSEPRLIEVYENLLGNGQHFCHSVNNSKICRGGRNFQLKWLCTVGMLDEPTDEAFNQAMKETLER
ncbi:MAG: hypothetical protein QQW96_03930 [Tychonema bourrellyi B0820]|nr:hypothetical protein [Tychonema bourrellyi B0820]PJE45212.1 MAG: hypothetical protein CUR32_01020 [Flavobacterium sp.] [Flavobacterium sp. FEMGT703F]